MVARHGTQVGQDQPRRRSPGLAISDFALPIEELEHVVRSTGSSAWETAEWTVSSPFVERWRHRWASAFEVMRGSHLMYNRIPSRKGDDLISSSLLTVTQVDQRRGLHFTIVNIDDSQGADSVEIRYDYDGLSFPIADTLFFVGGRVDGAEPFSMVLDLPDARGTLSGYVVAVGRAPVRHYPMARRVVIVPRSSEILSVKATRSELGIFALADAPQIARRLTVEQG